MESQLSITLLGSPSIALDGAPVRGFVSSKATALVYYLAATGRTHTRESLAGLLWGEASDSQAAKNLRDVLSNLRRLLDPYLAITRQTVALTPAALEAVDCRRFTAGIAAAERLPAPESAAPLRDAMALYRGDFLEGFYVPSAPAFEEWAYGERERQRQLALNALHRLAALAAEQGAYEEGVAHAMRLLAMEPAYEEGHRQLMRMLALSGQRGQALAQYATCRRVLNDELGVDPDAATETLYRQILDGQLRIENEELRMMRAQPEQFSILHSQFSVSNLPAPVGSFVGREAELAQLAAWLRDPEHRLVTITGMGGAGKTRLALQAARQLAPISQPDGAGGRRAAFVALAAIQADIWGDFSASTVMFPVLAARIADSLGLTFSGPEPPHTQLSNFLRAKDLLLVLDNCEHLPGVADFTVGLLQQAPRLTILATSRVRLNVRGEQVVELEGLQFPTGQRLTGEPRTDRRQTTDHGPRTTDHYSQWSTTNPADYSALQLFQRAAQTVNPRFVWTPAEVDAAIRICALVDGLPLGIELAASLVRLLSCAEIAREIEANLGFLQHTHRDLPERHRSLRAVFDHSWRLLSAAEQRALRQLSVFRGGFSRDAAAQVAGASFALLAALADSSLVRRGAEAESDAVRYELLELVRQYAAEQLAEAQRHDDAPALQDQHCHYYMTFLRQRRADLRGARQQTALAEIHREIENIRAAWRWAVDQGHAAIVGEAAESLFHFYEMRSWFQEAAEVFAYAAARFAGLAASDPDPTITLAWGKLLARQGCFTFHLGQQAAARALLEQSQAVLRPLGADGELVFSLNYLAAVAAYLGDYAEARRLCAEGLAISQTRGDRYSTAIVMTQLGQITATLGDYAEARRLCQESLAIDRAAGHRWGMAFSLITLGNVAYALGGYQESFARFQEALQIRAALRDARGMALCLNHLGDTAAAQGDYADAGQRYQAALVLFEELGNLSGASAALARLGHNALALGDTAAARAHFQAAPRAAWSTQALPRALEALAGTAITLAEQQPRRARGLAELVRRHPAATQEGRDRAADLIERLAPQAGNGVEQQWVSPPLDDVVAELLDEQSQSFR